MAEGKESVPVTEFDGFDFVPVQGQADSGAPSEDSGNEVEKDIFDESIQGEADSNEGEADEEGDEGEGEAEEVSNEQSGDSEESPDSSEDEPSEEEEADLKAKAIAEEVRSKNQPKPIKAKAGDKTVELTPDTEFEQKVDGKVEKVSLRQLLDSYASGQATHKRYRQFENEKRVWEQQKSEFNAVIDGFTKRVKEGDPISAVMDLISASGANPLQTIRTIREALIAEGRDFLNLSEEQRRLIYAEEEREWLKKQNENLVKLQTTEKQKQQLEMQVTAVMQQYGIPDKDTFLETVDEMQSYAKAQNLSVQIQPNMVGEFYQAKQLKRSFDEVLAEEAPQIKEGSSDYEQLAEVIAKVKPSKEEIRRVLRELYGKADSRTQRAKSDSKSVKPGAKKANRADKMVDVDPGLDINATPSVADWRSLLGEA